MGNTIWIIMMAVIGIIILALSIAAINAYVIKPVLKVNKSIISYYTGG